MTTGRVLGALLLAGAALPAWAQPAALADADLLYCAAAYADGAALLGNDADPRLRRTASAAAVRARALAVHLDALRLEDPARHERASAQARDRLDALPAMPVEARRLALRAALVECRYLEAGNGRATVPAAAPAAAPSPAPGPLPKPVTVPLPVPTLVAPVRVPLPVPTATASSAVATTAAVPTGTPSAPTVAPPTQGIGTAATSPATAPASATPVAAMAGTPAGVAATAAAAPATARRKDKTATPTPALRAPEVADKPAPANGLGDTDLLYCTQVYGEVVTAFGNEKGEAADAAREARARWLPLSAREHDLLNDSPDRHSRALAAARPRLAVLPEAPGRARSMALRSAYEECLGLEERAAAAGRPVPGGDRLQMLAKRRFCRDLLMSKLKVSARVRAGFSPSELASLEEIQKIGEALALPLPGAAVTLEQDVEANREARRLRDALEGAAAGWHDGPDPVAQAIGRCHDDYVQGRLGGPDVLSPPADASPSPAATAAPGGDARLPVMQAADLGPVFHIREVTPAGNIDGIWVRRGASNLYDGVWVQAANGQMQRDVLELRGIIDGQLTLYRQGYRGTYQAKVRADGRLEPGTASWFKDAGYTWAPLPSQPVRGANLGAIVHMREATPLGNYEGIWRQRGQTGVYDVLWVFLPTGEVTSDVLVVTGAAKGKLIIQRQDGPGLYALKRRADAMPPGAAGKGGRPLAQWEVLPAQSVRLGKAAR